MVKSYLLCILNTIHTFTPYLAGSKFKIQIGARQTKKEKEKQ